MKKHCVLPLVKQYVCVCKGMVVAHRQAIKVYITLAEVPVFLLALKLCFGLSTFLVDTVDIITHACTCSFSLK